MTTRQLLSSNSYIQFPKFLGAHIGSNEALILSAFCDIDSWCELNVENYDGWFYALQSDIRWETGLSEKQQRLAIQNLVNIELLRVDRRGIPAKNYFYIVSEELENRLDIAYTEYKLHKSQILQKVTSRPDETEQQEVTKNEFLLLNKNKNIIINNKSTLPGALSKNHSQVYKQRTTLTDDLESGKDIDKHEKEKKKSPKDKFKDNCLAMIDDTSYDSETKSLLIEYFSFASDPKQAEDSDARKKIVNSSKLWEQKLNALAQLVKQGNSAKDVVRQSLEKRKYAFWEYKEQTTTKSYSDHSDGIIVQTLSQEEAREVLKGYAERNGVV